MRVPALKLALGLGLGLSCGLMSARAALAESPTVFELEVSPACERVDVLQLARLLNIEARRRAQSRSSRVDVTCHDDVVTLRLELHGEPSSPRSRDFAAGDVAGEVGARVLSLAAIELFDEVVDPPKPVVELAPEPASEAAESFRPTPYRPRFVPSVRLMAAGAVQTIDFGRPLAGGGISVDYLRLASLGLRLQFDVALGNRQYDLGIARVRLTTLSAQAGYLALHEAWTARALVGYRFGTARIAGQSSLGAEGREGTVAGAYGGPLISAGLGLREGSFVAELGAEAGLVSFPLRGEIYGTEPIALDGYWLGLSLNAGALL